MRTEVYFVLAEELNRVKIGVSDDVLKRIRTIETGCPCKLKLVGSIRGTYQLERQLHRDFAKHRVIGEWFQYDPLKEVIREMLAADSRRA